MIMMDDDNGATLNKRPLYTARGDMAWARNGTLLDASRNQPSTSCSISMMMMMMIMMMMVMMMMMMMMMKMMMIMMMVMMVMMVMTNG